ncbi:photosystem II cytochrome c-550 [Candidatus Thiothrix anitrata]|uniref:Cytochrome c-550 n=1 Tax=Candidatus Thiothrix anitrata TaxID=2823902 RepID=A0ABX7X2D2_9GAMM|nr:photosystem II cytochrome c-550 [Candidatus Thiothrix anitrata]QTR48943.1 cytochrome c-550 [Candidatus Thiothrix anitrata]
MFRKQIHIVASAILLTAQIFVGSVTAAELDEETRTVPLNAEGDVVVLSPKQIKVGKRLFNFACAQCHAGGITKSNQNVGLDPEALAGATPNRNSIAGLVDYLHNPTTYDGEYEISELHPSIKSSDIFPAMRNLTDDDLTMIAGHILIQPKILGSKWGRGRISN